MGNPISLTLAGEMKLMKLLVALESMSTITSVLPILPRIHIDLSAMSWTIECMDSLSSFWVSPISSCFSTLQFRQQFLDPPPAHSTLPLPDFGIAVELCTWIKLLAITPTWVVSPYLGTRSHSTVVFSRLPWPRTCSVCQIGLRETRLHCRARLVTVALRLLHLNQPRLSHDVIHTARCTANNLISQCLSESLPKHRLSYIHWYMGSLHQ
ncbi:uncharacterized protein LOC112082894 [Eutrema salsugineum]|uniref:uncharacterized protein LOC112082894 n=1 Tax=Eutrema salsugineum TaxID=72664 RepID=UPI000CECFBA4|nr:uncharacterized protein LOC112082894 [Eutrema salsugineum]